MNTQSIEEIVNDLFSIFSDKDFAHVIIREQGFSRIITVTKLLKHFGDNVYIWKIAERKNAALFLVIDPVQEGYSAQIDTDTKQHGRDT